MLRHVHFEDAASHPFQPRPTGFPRVNVWWLAEAALALYWAPAGANRLFQAAGLECQYLHGGGTDCYVAWQTDWLLVAFRGTQPDQWADILADVKFAQVSWDAGLVHSGFATALDDVWPSLKSLLDTLSPGRSVWFCGHSLGASLATLAAYRYGPTHGVWTLGSPRIGDPAFAAAFNTKVAGKAVRYVNDQDVVTHVPAPSMAPWFYKHVDPHHFISSDGGVSEGGPGIQHFFEDLIGHPMVLLETIHGLSSGTLTLAPTFLLDHMPKVYAIWMWNDYAAHG